MSKEYYPILKFFNYSHLPKHLQEKSKLFHDLALELLKNSTIDTAAKNQQFEVGLQKLLETKDCFVRASV